MAEYEPYDATEPEDRFDLSRDEFIERAGEAGYASEARELCSAQGSNVAKAVSNHDQDSFQKEMLQFTGISDEGLIDLWGHFFPEDVPKDSSVGD